MKTIISICAAVLLLCMAISDSSAGGNQASAPATQPTGIEMRGTRRIVHLPEVKYDLPNAKGKDTVTVACGVCHTPKYIMLQPPFPKETWVAEVTKMRKTYMAPIPDEKVDEIVNYLMAVRGK